MVLLRFLHRPQPASTSDKVFGPCILRREVGGSAWWTGDLSCTHAMGLYLPGPDISHPRLNVQ